MNSRETDCITYAKIEAISCFDTKQKRGSFPIPQSGGAPTVPMRDSELVKGSRGQLALPTYEARIAGAQHR